MAVTRAGRARGEVHLVRLDPTLGSEIQKTRPGLVVFSAVPASSSWTGSALSMPNACFAGYAGR